MNRHTPTPPNSDQSDWLWGAEAIGAVINRTPEQVYYLHAAGLLRGATWKMGAKQLVGSREKLRALPALLASETS
jgi:hypothetical protein